MRWLEGTYTNPPALRILTSTFDYTYYPVWLVTVLEVLARKVSNLLSNTLGTDYPIFKCETALAALRARAVLALTISVIVLHVIIKLTLPK